MTRFISDGASLSPTSPMHIAVSNDGVQWDLISKQGLSVGSIFQAVPEQVYPYPTKTFLILTKNDGEKMFFELQDLKGGDLVAYNDGTHASLNAAVKVVGHWVVSI